MRRMRKQLGMSLIEIIIALGVGAVVVYGIASILRNTAKQVESLGGKNDFNSFINELQGVFNNSEMCRKAFASTGTVLDPAKFDALGEPADPATKPLEFSLDVTPSSTAPKHVIYAQGSKWGNSLTVLNLQMMGKSRAAELAAEKRSQWSIPIRVVVSRRAVTTAIETSTGTGTATDTFSSTDTTSGTLTSTATATSLPSGYRFKKGSEAAFGGDLLQKTFLLTVSLEGGKVVGCSGQFKDFWSFSTRSQVITGTGTSVATMTSLDIVYKDVGMVIVASPGYAVDTSLATAPQVAVDGYVQAGKPGGYRYPSDARLKRNIRSIPDAEARVSQLHGVLFDWKPGATSEPSANQLGFLAQEVEKVFPEAVVTSPSLGLKSVQYENLVAPLVEAVKERQKRLERNENALESLRQELRKRAP